MEASGNRDKAGAILVKTGPVHIPDDREHLM
jgi:hypothetical protein